MVIIYRLLNCLSNFLHLSFLLKLLISELLFYTLELQPLNILKAPDNLPETDDINISHNENVVQDSKVKQKRRKTHKKMTKRMQITMSREACSSGSEYVNRKGNYENIKKLFK